MGCICTWPEGIRPDLRCSIHGRDSNSTFDDNLNARVDRWHCERETLKEKIANAVLSRKPTHEKIDIAREILEELDMMDYREGA